jgi:hypothetical protein
MLGMMILGAMFLLLKLIQGLEAFREAYREA